MMTNKNRRHMYKLNEMSAENIEKNELRIEKELRTQENKAYAPVKAKRKGIGKLHGGTTKNPRKI